MKNTLFAFFILLFSSANAQTFSWSGYTAGSTTYSTGIMTSIITSSAPNFQYSSPRYYSGSTVGSGQCGMTGGLALEQLFGNVTSAHVTLTMSFTSGGTTNGTCASMQFQIKDINADESNMTFRDFVHISAIDGNNIAIPVANITATGGSNKTITTSGGTTRIIAGSSGTYGSRSSTACDNVTITVTPPAGVPLKSISLRYQPSYEAASSTTGYWNFMSPYRPAYQYISIGSITGTSTVGCVVLPVQLTAFNATCNGKTKQFNWTTASETNNDGFVLEGSSDGEQFDSLQFIFGDGTTNRENNYVLNYTDVTNTYRYFRLKQIDRDGKKEFSSAIFVECENNSSVNIFPNPCDHVLTISLPNEFEEELLYTVVDVSGAIVKQQLFSKDATTQHQLDLSSLAKGAYYLLVKSESGKINQREKFIKN